MRLARSTAAAYDTRTMATVSAAQILNAKILVVDDVEANVVLLERLLLDAGYTSVSSTQDPHEVCELQRRHRYSLILLDLQMPGMDGFQVLEALKEVEKDDYCSRAGDHGHPHAQAARAAGRREGFHQQAVRGARDVDPGAQHVGGAPAPRGGP